MIKPCYNNHITIHLFIPLYYNAQKKVYKVTNTKKEYVSDKILLNIYDYAFELYKKEYI